MVPTWIRWICGTPYLSLSSEFTLSFYLHHISQVVSYLQFSHWNPVCTSMVSHASQCPIHNILYLIILTISGQQHKLWNSSRLNYIQSSYFFLWNSNTLLATLFSITLSLCSSLMWQLERQTHTKRTVKNYGAGHFAVMYENRANTEDHQPQL
jgi:hypothetical protein